MAYFIESILNGETWFDNDSTPSKFLVFPSFVAGPSINSVAQAHLNIIKIIFFVVK